MNHLVQLVLLDLVALVHHGCLEVLDFQVDHFHLLALVLLWDPVVHLVQGIPEDLGILLILVAHHDLVAHQVLGLQPVLVRLLFLVHHVVQEIHVDQLVPVVPEVLEVLVGRDHLSGLGYHLYRAIPVLLFVRGHLSDQLVQVVRFLLSVQLDLEVQVLLPDLVHQCLLVVPEVLVVQMGLSK